MLGHIYLRKKEFDKALNNYKKVLDLNPQRERTKFNLSWCYFALLKFEQAFEYYEFRKEMIQAVKAKLEKPNLDSFCNRLYEDCRS